ncbi:MerR family transcriptional regulator [Embleya sp. NPDC020630]|uniref:MerR family transcriptional regulator n=1 Tax=Embleya sp. NPDC020630 TaxID=3363979 RepID=UPI0037BBF048
MSEPPLSEPPPPASIRPGDLEQELDLTAGAAASRLGVAATTLRSWDRRYHLGASRTSAGGHRRYSPDDMARLRRMCALVADGVPVADAARAVLGGGKAGPTKQRPAGRSGGGHTFAVGTHASRQARGLARAAMRLDGAAVHDILDREITEHGVAATWENLAQPVLYGMGRKWEGGRGNRDPNTYVEVEHLLSECVLAALHRACGRSHTTDARGPCAFGNRGVLLACTDKELHTLPLHALNAALIERGIATRMFGAALPADALGRAIARTRPSAVVLWSQNPDTADARSLDLLRDIPGTTVLAAGAGWGATSARGTVRLTSLTQALTVLTPTPTRQPHRPAPRRSTGSHTTEPSGPPNGALRRDGA